MKRAPRSRQRHDLYAKYHDYDSEISDLLGECGLKGGFDQTPADYAALIRRFGDWEDSGMKIAVSQDYMCEPFVLKQTGLSVADHQAMTVDRFDAIQDAGTGRVPLMPVLQGWTVADYLRHLDQYGARILVPSGSTTAPAKTPLPKRLSS